MSLTFSVDAKLNNGSPVQLVLDDERDGEPLRRLYRVIVDEANSCSHDQQARPFDLWPILKYGSGRNGG